MRHFFKTRKFLAQFLLIFLVQDGPLFSNTLLHHLAPRSELVKQSMERDSMLGIGRDGFSIDDYFKLSEEEKVNHRENFSNVFKTRENSEVSSDTPDYLKVYPLTRDDDMRAFMKVSNELREWYPDQRMIALGRSPLWLFEMSRLLDFADGKDIALDRYTYIAFSGRWWQWDEELYKLVSTREQPSPRQVTAYRKYLSELGLHPTAIIQDQRQTVLVDVVFSKGAGLRSFLQVLLDWSEELGIREALQSKITLHILQDEKVRVAFSGLDLKTIFPNVVYQDLPHELIQGLSRSPDEPQWKPFQDSLGISHSYQNWEKGNPLEAKVSPNAQLVQFRIIDSMAQLGMLDDWQARHRILEQPLSIEALPEMDRKSPPNTDIAEAA
jgi:hypothetical protein